MTVSEQRLWNWLRNRTFGGFKFRRQVPAGRYVLDFYCPALKLAIEVDGQHHETPWTAEYDDERTRYLQSQGIDVVRITNKLLARPTRCRLNEYWSTRLPLAAQDPDGVLLPSPRRRGEGTRRLRVAIALLVRRLSKKR